MKEGDFENIIYKGIYYGDSLPIPTEVLAKAGFEFTGWSPSLADTVTGDLVYTALWKKSRG